MRGRQMSGDVLAEPFSMVSCQANFWWATMASHLPLHSGWAEGYAEGCVCQVIDLSHLACSIMISGSCQAPLILAGKRLLAP